MQPIRQGLTVADAAAARHAIRSYTDAPIPDDDLQSILATVGLAPSAWNLQPWRIVVVRDPELKQQLMTAAPGQKQVGAAPLVFVFYTDMHDVLNTLDEIIHPSADDDRRAATKRSIRRYFDERSAAEATQWGVAQTFIAVGYLLLAAQSLGYATSPMQSFQGEAVKQLLGLAPSAAVAALVAMGVANETARPHHRHHLNRFATIR
jgi:nitroreductase